MYRRHVALFIESWLHVFLSFKKIKSTYKQQTVRQQRRSLKPFLSLPFGSGFRGGFVVVVVFVLIHRPVLSYLGGLVLVENSDEKRMV